MRYKGNDSNDDTDDISIQKQTGLMGLVRKAIKHKETLTSIKAILHHCINSGSQRKYCVKDYKNPKKF